MNTIPPEVRETMIADAKGRIVESLYYETEDAQTGPYWVMTFTDGSEMNFRFMSELVRQ